MQRVRMSLPYFRQNGWDAEVVIVDPKYCDIQKDELLVKTIPGDIKVHTVNAFNKNWSIKIGLGNIALRSLWQYRKKVNQLLKEKKFDLIYFSTTQFAVCILGAYWKKHFGIPYVIDMQDPWHSDYYQDKPKHQQPPKYWFSYRLNKYLEPLALKHADGLISVSESYIIELKKRYPIIKDIPAATITFGSFGPDMLIAQRYKSKFIDLLEPGFKNIVYIGRGGIDMHAAITPVFKAFKQLLIEQPKLYRKVKFYFIGTSYAPKGEGIVTILPLAAQFELSANVVEITDRIGYFHTLATLQVADALFIPGSNDPKYTASKIYPYIVANKPLLAVFNSKSSVLDVLNECNAPHTYSYDTGNLLDAEIQEFLHQVVDGTIATPNYDEVCLKKHDASNMAKKQTHLFNIVLNNTDINPIKL